jgi:hypothetical protein
MRLAPHYVQPQTIVIGYYVILDRIRAASNP